MTGKEDSVERGSVMKNTVEMLDEIQNKALHDSSLREQFLQTRKTDDPLGEFCRASA